MSESKTKQADPDFSDEFSDDDDQNNSGEFDQGDDDESSSSSDFSDDDDDDDDDDMDDSFNESGNFDKGQSNKNSEMKISTGGGAMKTKRVENEHFDEAVDLDDGSLSEESVDTSDAQSPKMRRDRDIEDHIKGVDRGDSPPRGGKATHTSNLSDSEDIPGDKVIGGNGEIDKTIQGEQERRKTHGVKLNAGGAEMSAARERAAAKNKNRDGDSGSEASSSGDDEESNADSTGGEKSTFVSGYNPEDFAHLNVSGEIRELFQYIMRYKPHDIQLDARLRCFIPDYIPSVGEIDAFIKVPKPDGEADELGLKVLDEPSSNQSDPTVLDLQLRAISKKSNLEPMVVRSIENADKNPKLIANWIKSIKELHRSKPPPQVNYTKPMPDVESLMQVWPEEIESLLKDIRLPPADIDLDLKDYVRVICSVFDIPVYSSMTESLHVLFTLYSEFVNNQHFRNMNGGGADPMAEARPHFNLDASIGDASFVEAKF